MINRLTNPALPFSFKEYEMLKPWQGFALLILCLSLMALLMIVTGCTLEPIWTLNGLQHRVVCP